VVVEGVVMVVVPNENDKLLLMSKDAVTLIWAEQR
jgi:hypothetical protein